MSDFLSCCSDETVDDVVLQRRGILLARALFSNPANFGPYANQADRFVYRGEDDPKNGIDVQDWTERFSASPYSRPTVFVNVDNVTIPESQFINDESEDMQDGSTRRYVYLEQCRLVFRAVTHNGPEARLLGRVIMTYLQGMKEHMTMSSNDQVTLFRVMGKTAPTKLKDEGNRDDRWAVDVTVNVEYQIQIDSKLVAPVLSEVLVNPEPE